jgi:uncharacterized protein (TIGR00369 family)
MPMSTPGQQPVDGLAQVQAMLDSGRQPPMNEMMGIALVSIERGRSVFEGAPGPSVYNPMGAVHGGYVATLLDSACGIAVHTALSAGQSYTTIELKVSYLRPLSQRSGRVRAEGALVSLVAAWPLPRPRLFDEAGRLCATASSTLMVFGAK